MKLYDTIYWDYGYDEWRVSTGVHNTQSYRSYPVSYSDPLEKYLDKDVWDHVLWEIELDLDQKVGKVIRIVSQVSALPPLSERPQHPSGMPWKTMHRRIRMRNDWQNLPVWDASCSLRGIINV